MRNTDIVFVHGWGLNSEIWVSYIDAVHEALPNVNIHNLDLPGYGQISDMESSSDLAVLAKSCAERAPDNALWVGWSLGGMVALKAAMLTENKVAGLQLIGTLPRFVGSPDWSNGVDLSVFQRFCDALASDYRSALSTFLLLQSGTSSGARALAKQSHKAVCAWPDPSRVTLQHGIDCLSRSDLRSEIAENHAIKTIPTQVVVGELDRVANPQGGRALAEMMCAELVCLKTGHAPFLTQPAAVLECLKQLVILVESDVS